MALEKVHLLGTTWLTNSLSSQKTRLEITFLAESTGINTTCHAKSIWFTLTKLHMLAHSITQTFGSKSHTPLSSLFFVYMYSENICLWSEPQTTLQPAAAFNRYGMPLAVLYK